jgi:hypothetical protein
MSVSDDDVKRAVQQYGPVKRRVVLRLGKDDGKFEPWNLEPDTLDADFEGYLACLHLSRVYKSIEKRMSDQKKLKTFKKREAAAEAKSKIKFAKRKTKEKIEVATEIE